jgi:hypothetical protein
MTDRTYPVIVQDWIESESGWGQRDDGYSVHLNNKDREKFIEEYWAGEKKRNPSGVTPSCYIRPGGNPALRDVDEDTYKKLEKLRSEGKYGMTIWHLSDLDTKEQKLAKEKIQAENARKEKEAKEKLELIKKQALAKLTTEEKAALKLV